MKLIGDIISRLTNANLKKFISIIYETIVFFIDY